MAGKKFYRGIYPKFDAVVFDMDGVIFDTEKLVLKSWQEVARRHGVEDIESVCRACLGLNQKEAEKKFCEKYGDDFPYWEYKKETRALFFEPYYGEHLPIKPGAEGLLKELKRRKIPVALATSTRREVVEKELRDADLFQYFNEIVCGDMVEHSKPHPEIFTKACELLGVDPAKSYAIEDSFHGIRAAHAAGMRTIMVPDMVEPDFEIELLCNSCQQSLDHVYLYLFGFGDGEEKRG